MEEGVCSSLLGMKPHGLVFKLDHMNKLSEQMIKNTFWQKGQGLMEYALILALVAAGSILMLAIVGGDVGDVFSRVANSLDTNDPDFPPGTIAVSVMNEQKQSVSGTWVYAFNDAGDWTGVYQQTNSEGVALFEDVERGGYQFLAYKSPHYYWSNTISYPQQNRAEIVMRIKSFTVDVVDGSGDGLQNVYVYAYTSNEKYWLGVYGRTDKNGSVTVDLPDGDYKFRAYYNGQYFWSPAVNSPAQSATVIDIKMQSLTVTIVNDAGDAIEQKNLYVYGYTENGSYAGIYDRTDKNGAVEFSVPAGRYKFRVYYRGSNYWSEVVASPAADATVIKTGERPFTVNIMDDSGTPAKNVRVHVYTSSGAYVGLSKRTNKQGQIVFDLPAGNYKFRADYKGDAFWSATVSSPTTTNTTITVSK